MDMSPDERASNAAECGFIPRTCQKYYSKTRGHASRNASSCGGRDGGLRRRPPPRRRGGHRRCVRGPRPPRPPRLHRPAPFRHRQREQTRRTPTRPGHQGPRRPQGPGEPRGRARARVRVRQLHHRRRGDQVHRAAGPEQRGRADRHVHAIVQTGRAHEDRTGTRRVHATGDGGHGGEQRGIAVGGTGEDTGEVRRGHARRGAHRGGAHDSSSSHH